MTRKRLTPLEISAIRRNAVGKTITSIAGISGTKSEFSSSVTDGDFLFVGDVPIAPTTISGDATVTLTSNRYEYEGSFAAVGVTASDRVMVWLRAGTPQDENTADMLELSSISATADTDSITVNIKFTELTKGPILLHWSTV